MSVRRHAPPDSAAIQGGTEGVVHVGAYFSTDLARRNISLASDAEASAEHAPTCTAPLVSEAIARENPGAYRWMDMHRQSHGVQREATQSVRDRAAEPPMATTF